MKLSITPQKLKSLLESAMLYSHGKSLIRPIVLTSTKDSLEIKQCYSEIIAVYTKYNSSYFDSFVSKDETTMLTDDIFEEGGLPAFKDEKLTLTTDTKIQLKDSKNTYEIEQEIEPEIKLPFDYTELESGYFPDNQKPTFSAIINVSELSLPKAEILNFIVEKKKLSVLISKKGKSTHKIALDGIIDSGDVDVKVDGEYFNLLTSFLTDKVFFAINENCIVLSQLTDEYSKTFVLSVRYD